MKGQRLMKQFTSDLIRSGRETRGISQWGLARKLKLKSAQSISNIERGIAPVPVKHVHTLLKTLKIPMKFYLDAYLLDHLDELEKTNGYKKR